MNITLDGKSGAGFASEQQARMHVRTLVDRVRAEFGMADCVGDEKIAYAQGDDNKWRAKGKLAFD